MSKRSLLYRPVALELAVLALSVAGSSPALAWMRQHAPAVSPRPAVRARSVGGRPGVGWVSVIVTMRPGQDRGAERQFARLGGSVYRHLPLIHADAIRLPSRRLPDLMGLSSVAHVSPDLAVRKSDAFTVASSEADVAYACYGATGRGVTIALIDSGVSPHNDLTDPSTGSYRLLASVSLLSGTSSAADACGHGTHVAGIAAGNGLASSGSNCTQTFYGIARQASIVSVRVLDQHGAGTVSDAIAGVQWVVSNRATYNIRVLNLSLGHPVGESYTTDPLCQAVEQAWKAGIVVVCAAGNGGRLNPNVAAGLANEGWGTAYGSIQSPGNDPYVITVGAMKPTGNGRSGDRIATYSARGPSRLDFVLKPDLVAPGNAVVSLLVGNPYLASTYTGNLIPFSYYTTNTSSATSSRYYRLSGTSMAAPVVSGAAALMLAADPTLSPDTVKARLMLTADKWTYPDGSADLCTFGAGYLDIPAALQCRAVATRPAISPQLYRDTTGLVYLNASQLLWGGSTIWGVDAVPDAQLIWGTELAAGTEAVPESQLIWGTGVWTDQLIWGTSSASVDLTTTAIAGDP